MECAGLVLLGYPLYPAGKRGARDAWRDGQLPLGPGASLRMLLLTGTRDDLCALDDLRAVVAPAGRRAHVVEVVAADHSFDVLVRSGRTRREVLAELVDVTDAWIRERAR
jgi:predicted alpha/beta-hydrolase family hydrolase